MKTQRFILWKGDCLKRMRSIPNGKIDLILCDLPYGTTACAWDSPLDFAELWSCYERVIKPRAPIVLFGDEPFSSALRLSKPTWYKYDWYWRKTRPSGFVNAKLKPLKDIETISVFSSGATANGSKQNMPYFPQGLELVNRSWSRPRNYAGSPGVSPSRASHNLTRVQQKSGYPRQVLDFANPNHDVVHPTQKPTDLLKYLVETYTEEGALVMDNTMGSGSTGVACMELHRHFLGIEQDPEYFQTAKRRVREAANQFWPR